MTRWSPAEGRRLTFAELRDEVRRAAAAMIDLGVGAGDRVAIWSPNTWHWVVACLATTYAGGVLVPLNTRYTASEAADILARTGAPLLFASGEFLGADKAASVDRDTLPELRHIVRVPIEKDDGTWDEFIARGYLTLDAADARAAAVKPDDVSDILFTSGTTGRSKGALCAHRQSLARLGGMGRVRADHQRRPLPVHQPVLPQLRLQGRHPGVPADRGNADPAADVRPRAGHAGRAATIASPCCPGRRRSTRRCSTTPSAANTTCPRCGSRSPAPRWFPVVLIERMQTELDIDIVLTAYGLTEANGFGTMCTADDDAVTVATTCGRPIADFELCIDDPAEDGTGEVLLRGPNVMLGYLDDPKATAAAIDPDGWLHTGDVGKLDAAGNLSITDRLKDMYICGGFNVYPAEVEQVLARLDGVAESAVIGVPDERLGEVGKAFVVTLPGVTLDEKTIIAYTREHLANFKTPRSVEFLDVLPRNPGGKVVKPLLRERV